MRKKYVICATLLAAACHTDSTPRMDLPEESVSIVKLKGYEVRHERGASLLVSKAADKRHSSILVRRLSFDRRHDRSPDSIAEATQASLTALPQARVKGPVSIEQSSLDGVRFDLSFEPKAKRGRTYERRHVVLFGTENAYHVLQTAPQGHLFDISDDFAKVVKSLREEG